MNISEAKKSIFYGLNQFISYWCNEKSIPEESLKQNHNKFKTNKNMLQSYSIKKSLEELRRKFILTILVKGSITPMKKLGLRGYHAIPPKTFKTCQ